jgi:predicted RNA-binding Zn-ribbon protein involved in translation (DUF1610 family)
VAVFPLPPDGLPIYAGRGWRGENMKLEKCAACGHDVSSQAQACPNCGHPIALAAETKARAKAQNRSSLGCGVVVLAVVGFFAYAINEGSKIEDQEKIHPTCVSDYTKCTDNKDVIDKHRNKNNIQMNIICKNTANDVAKYGTPDLPFFAFGTYYTGRSYVDSGTAILIEKDAQFKNVFGSAEHVTATCFYDLKNDEARVSITPN